MRIHGGAGKTALPDPSTAFARVRFGVLSLVLLSLGPLVPATRAAPPPAAAPAPDSLSIAIHGYAQLAHDEYGNAVRDLEAFRDSVHVFLARPSRESLARAREAWITSRDSYSRAESFRFAGGPIDDVHPVTGVNGPEGRINTWPIDEAFLDYVVGARSSGLIADFRLAVNESTLVSRNAAEDDAQVTLGYHAIEFLLWGQDRSREGPGARPFTDYVSGQPVRERRRACLSLVVELLLRDIASVAREWDPGQDRYVNVFLAMNPSQALGRALSGPATLAAFELGAERISIPLSSGLQEDEQSCFSDNTHRDIFANVEGIAAMLEGSVATPGLLVALRATHRADIRDRLGRVRRLAHAIPAPFDAILLSPADDPRRGTLRALATELIGLAGALQLAGAAVGARVMVGGG